MANNKNQLESIYKGKTIIITGHTGFKGSWLSIWLSRLGAKVVGLSIDIPCQPSNFEVNELIHCMPSLFLCVCHKNKAIIR